MIRTATPEDFLPLVLLERECFPLAERWSGSAWGEEVARDGHLALVHTGLEGVDAAAAFRVSDDFGDVLRVLVAPAARRRGIAAQLLEIGLTWAWEQGAERIMLEVRHDNSAAVELYRKYGFEALTVRRDYYGPDADALVMIRTFAAEEPDE